MRNFILGFVGLTGILLSAPQAASASGPARDCVFGPCPELRTAGPRPPMQCETFLARNFRERLHHKLRRRLADARIRINSDARAGEGSFVEIAGERHRLHPPRWERDGVRDKVFYFHDINSIAVEAGSRSPGANLSGYYVYMKFESERPELKGYCESCNRRRDKRAPDGHYGAGSKHKDPWAWMFLLHLHASFSPDGHGSLRFERERDPYVDVRFARERPTGWSMKAVRGSMISFARRSIPRIRTELATRVHNAVAYLPQEVLEDVTGERGNRLYYIAHATPPAERDGFNDRWTVCFRKDAPLAARPAAARGAPIQAPRTSEHERAREPGRSAQRGVE
ncbi:MAG: hypothetical protein MJE66_21755, partial [Proteobacteria bacterium]|nr:hypothetical protein [Pseudomonadota bacterium]